MALLVDEPFISHAGLQLLFKIECDALDDQDIETLARIVNGHFVFGKVFGVPRGGVRLAKALAQFCSPDNSRTLIVDDVFTTGTSMEIARCKVGSESVGVVIFARSRCPEWIHPIFELTSWAGP